ncbi:Hint domain-containing protein [Pseudobacteriovorax antillogorgiicola]|uniref:Hint domain-containing protein n=1 Tax=Pseudobacteriovorax antillogorgiicola TaxID=1513793 RepID=A0A1Y6CNX0_9BACT|nr:Hint domain-containing protein [Pseudobacteriovorax antillogorgiicola]TCS46630.1 hypothetical protein EDD56_1236 [Pseudobacteriovorax antillogorgiicola]SMF66069.1 hypothetical protein SAMN06296036_1236 [Pseudobacteriovorax antillogorgiicola]
MKKYFGSPQSGKISLLLVLMGGLAATAHQFQKKGQVDQLMKKAQLETANHETEVQALSALTVISAALSRELSSQDPQALLPEPYIPGDFNCNAPRKLVPQTNSIKSVSDGSGQTLKVKLPSIASLDSNDFSKIHGGDTSVLDKAKEVEAKVEILGFNCGTDASNPLLITGAYVKVEVPITERDTNKKRLWTTNALVPIDPPPMSDCELQVVDGEGKILKHGDEGSAGDVKIEMSCNNIVTKAFLFAEQPDAIGAVQEAPTLIGEQEQRDSEGKSTKKEKRSRDDDDDKKRKKFKGKGKRKDKAKGKSKVTTAPIATKSTFTNNKVARTKQPVIQKSESLSSGIHRVIGLVQQVDGSMIEVSQDFTLTAKSSSGGSGPLTYLEILKKCSHKCNVLGDGIYPPAYGGSYYHKDYYQGKAPDIFVCYRSGYYWGFDPNDNCKMLTESVDKRGAEGCFVENTMIRMADGSDRAIQTIRPGDLAWNPRLNQAQKISRVTKGPEHDKIYVIQTAQGTVSVTRTHPFVSTRGIVKAEFLKAGDMLLGDDSLALIEIKDIAVIDSPSRGQTVWNLELEGAFEASHHVILADGVPSGDLFLQNQNWDQAPYESLSQWLAE